MSAVPTTRTVNNKALSSNITLSAADVSAVPTTRTVNGKALSANITLTATDIGADASGAAATALTNAKSYTDTKVASLVNSAPETLNTLNELAAALGDDANFATTVTNQMSGKLDASELPAAVNNALAQAKASGEFDGTDGANGKDGTSATHSWSGTTLTITSASGTSSADLKGEKGDTGAAGKDGHSPVRGTDYWTDVDKAEIKSYVDEAILGGAW